MNNKFFSFKADFFKQQGKVKEKRTILKIKVLNFFQILRKVSLNSWLFWKSF